MKINWKHVCALGWIAGSFFMTAPLMAEEEVSEELSMSTVNDGIQASKECKPQGTFTKQDSKDCKPSKKGNQGKCKRKGAARQAVEGS